MSNTFSSLCVCVSPYQVSQMRNQGIAVAVACSLFGFFGFSIYPVAMELSVECSYPVGEATSAGLIFISGYCLILVHTRTTHTEDQDSKYRLMLISMCLFFPPDRSSQLSIYCFFRGWPNQWPTRPSLPVLQEEMRPWVGGVSQELPCVSVG